MAENSKISTLVRWVSPVFNVLYRFALLAVLIWIGLGLQDVAGALYGSGEACVIEPDAGDNGGDGTEPGVVKPLLRGST
jgi:hypothetical protein